MCCDLAVAVASRLLEGSVPPLRSATMLRCGADLRHNAHSRQFALQVLGCPALPKVAKLAAMENLLEASDQTVVSCLDTSSACGIIALIAR